MRRPLRRNLLLLALIGGLTTLAFPPSRAGGDTETPIQGLGLVEHAEVVLAEVPVWVSDRRGRPVTDLDCEDFEARIEGKPRAIADCRLIGTTAAGASSAPPAATGSTPPALIAIFVDHWNLSPSSRRRVFDALRRVVVERASEDRRWMLVSFDGTVDLVVPPTTDAQRTVAALDRMERLVCGRPAEDAERARLLEALVTLADPNDSIQAIESHADQFAQRVRYALDAFATFLDTLAGIEGFKLVIHVSDGLPRAPGEDIFSAFDRQFETGLGRLRAFSNDLSEEWAAVERAAHASRVTLDALVPSASNEPSSVRSASWSSLLQRADAERRSNLLGPLRELAEETGGLALSGHDIASWLRSALDSSSAHYSIAIELPSVAAGPLRLKIRTKDSSLRVRHRAELMVKTAEDELAEHAAAAARFDIEQNPLGCSLELAAPVPGAEEESLLPLTVRIPIESLTLLPVGGQHTARVRVAVAVQDDEGRSTPPLLQPPFEIHVPDADLDEALASYWSYALELQLRAGRQRIVVAVRDELDGDTTVLARQVRIER